ncbi:divergent polysaccharide deacetylase family protein, partial [Rhizobium leguminosarum]|uniref:divergent polysaccharide deacetylase family protein n=1 Tax=Rhizobium leguminosarum TaxID=384 RepID=UPI003F9773A2
MLDIGKRGLLFLDDGTSAQSKTAAIAKGTELPYSFADLQLDGQLDINAVLKKLDELEHDRFHGGGIRQETAAEIIHDA